MITKLKAVEKEREGLEGRKLEAEAYLAKQGERLRANITGNKILLHQTQVGGGGGCVGMCLLRSVDGVREVEAVGWFCCTRRCLHDGLPAVLITVLPYTLPASNTSTGGVFLDCCSPAGPTGRH
jgi:hypothetical protein